MNINKIYSLGLRLWPGGYAGQRRTVSESWGRQCWKVGTIESKSGDDMIRKWGTCGYNSARFGFYKWNI